MYCFGENACMGHGEGGDKVWMAYIKSKDAVAWVAIKNGSGNLG